MKKQKKDNTINISVPEKSLGGGESMYKNSIQSITINKFYSREEVLDVLHKLLNDMDKTECGILNVELKMVFEKDLFLANFNMDEWIKENLK